MVAPSQNSPISFPEAWHDANQTQENKMFKTGKIKMLQPYTNKGLFYMEIITKTIHKLTHNSDSNIGNKISACSFIPTRHRINISIRTKLNMHVSGTMSNNHYLVLQSQKPRNWTQIINELKLRLNYLNFSSILIH